MPTATIVTRAVASSSWAAHPAETKVNSVCQPDAGFIRELRFRLSSARDMASIERRTQRAQIDQKEISCLRIASYAGMLARNIYRRHDLDVHRMGGSAAAYRHRVLDIKRVMAGLIFVHDFREGGCRRSSLSRVDR